MLIRISVIVIVISILGSGSADSDLAERWRAITEWYLKRKQDMDDKKESTKEFSLKFHEEVQRSQGSKRCHNGNKHDDINPNIDNDISLF